MLELFLAQQQCIHPPSTSVQLLVCVARCSHEHRCWFLYRYDGTKPASLTVMTRPQQAAEAEITLLQRFMSL